MVAGASLFNQLLKHFPRTEFGNLLREHQAERHSKGFTCWSQFVSMLFCQVAQADSLREICNGLKCCLGKLSHLGLSRGPNKSTLSYANLHRPAALFEHVFWTTLERFRQQHLLGRRTHRFRFRTKLLSMDSTTIGLCLSLFPWARLRTGKGGIKAHVLLDHDDYMPRFVHLTEARASDVRGGPSDASHCRLDCGHRPGLCRLLALRKVVSGRRLLRVPFLPSCPITGVGATPFAPASAHSGR